VAPFPHPRILVTRSEQETLALGREMAGALGPGSVVLLSGDLGAGKTVFVKGIADGLGFNPRKVTSPTFTLVQEYHGGRLPLYHVDLYRLQSIEVDDLGLEEIAWSGGVIAIEWPDRLPRPLENVTAVHIDYGDDGDYGEDTLRTISIQVPDASGSNS
jgi:tRNA threonylcarbamoyladenosine biosynthesis protein TsaE